jgi:hypothetical protein
LAASIDLGVIKKIDAGVVRGGHALARGVLGELVAIGHPRPERKLAELETGAAEPAVLHLNLWTEALRRERGAGADILPEARPVLAVPGKRTIRRRATSAMSPIILAMEIPCP